MDVMKRVPEHVRKRLKNDYVQMMKRHKQALTKAYPVGLRFMKNYIQVPEDVGATWAVVRTFFRYADYDTLTWTIRGVIYSFYIYYKKLDKLGRPNGKERVIGHHQFDAGCRVIEDTDVE